MIGLLAVILLVPATLALVRLLRPARPLLARLGGSLAIIGVVDIAAPARAPSRCRREP
jgi:hypothetical protein